MSRARSMLGHKSMNTTLLEVGFEYVCKKDGLMFFRKQK